MPLKHSNESDGRVVVTGMGAVTVIGESTAEFWSSLSAGRSGIGRWKRKGWEKCYSKIGGDLSGFDLEAHLDRIGNAYPSSLKDNARRLLRVSPLPGRLTAAAALQAFLDAGMTHSRPDPNRTGHVLAGHQLTSGFFVENMRTYFEEEPDFIDPLFGLVRLDTDALAVTSEILDLRGQSFTVGGACASSNLGILAGLDAIRTGRADAMFVSGGSIEVDPVTLHGWAMIDALSYRSFNESPEKASRPFDAHREGFVPSEGAGVLVLESLASARKRGARIHAEIFGASSASDACRLTKPNQEGQVRAIRLALADGKLPVDKIDYVNAHATSTPLGDAVEVAAIKEVFGERAKKIPVNSTKSMIGHCLTAAGAVEMIATILQMSNGIVHPTINQEQVDPQLDLDFVPNHAREHRIRYAISNSFGFGGMNSCVAVGVTS